LRQGVRRSLESAGAHADALGRQELRVPEMSQVVRTEIVLEQAPGISMSTRER